MKLPQHNEFFYTFSRFFHENLKPFTIHSFCFQHPMMAEHPQFINFILHVCFQHKLELQIITSTLVHGNCGTELYHILTELLSVSTHVFDGACVINSVKKHVFNGLHGDCNCFTLISIIWSILCTEFFVLPPPLCVYSFHFLEPLVIELVISMVSA